MFFFCLNGGRNYNTLQQSINNASCVCTYGGRGVGEAMRFQRYVRPFFALREQPERSEEGGYVDTVAAGRIFP